MKKFKNITIGGIQQKIINLVLITFILLVAAYTTVILYQSKRLTNLVSDVNASQRDSINDISNSTMTGVLDANLTQSTQMEAYIAEDLFTDAVKVVNIVADYTAKLFANPSDYPARDVEEPDKSKDGQISVQVLKEEGIDLNEPTIASKLNLIGNLSDLMMATFANANVDSCYCALPDGVMLLVDDHSGTKFDENDNIISIPVRQRLWYKGAQETGKLYFTDVTTDLFTGEISIMCALPIYNGNDLVAVIGVDLFLNDVSNAINNIARDGSFVCIINQNGHVLFSPQEEGVFKTVSGEDAIDVRTLGNEELTTFINDSVTGPTNVRLIELDDGYNYVAGAPIGKVGWTIISVVPKALADSPTNAMLNELDNIQTEAIDTYNEGMSKAKLTIYVLIATVLIIGITISIIISKRIVKPFLKINENNL